MSLYLKFDILEVPVCVLGQNVGASNCLIVMRGVLGFSRSDVIVSESGVVFLILRDKDVSNDVDEGNAQHTTDTGQDGFHPFESLCGGGEVKGNGGVLRLLIIGSSSVFKSLLLLEQIDVVELGLHQRGLGHTDHAASSVLVSDPKGQNFEPGHSQFSDW